MFQEKIVTLDEKARNLIKVCALSSVGWSKVYVRGVARDERQKVALRLLPISPKNEQEL